MACHTAMSWGSSHHPVAVGWHGARELCRSFGGLSLAAQVHDVCFWLQVVASMRTSMAARCVKFSPGSAHLLAIAEHQVGGQWWSSKFQLSTSWEVLLQMCHNTFMSRLSGRVIFNEGTASVLCQLVPATCAGCDAHGGPAQPLGRSDHLA